MIPKSFLVQKRKRRIVPVSSEGHLTGLRQDGRPSPSSVCMKKMKGEKKEKIANKIMPECSASQFLNCD